MDVARRLQHRSRMLLRTRFEELADEYAPLLDAWDGEEAAIMHTVCDVNHHVCVAIAFLDQHGDAPFDRLDGEARAYAHEGFLAVLAFAQLMRRAAEDRLAPAAIALRAERAACRLLDAFAPRVSGADVALRRVLLDEASLDDAVAGLRGVC